MSISSCGRPTYIEKNFLDLMPSPVAGELCNFLPANEPLSFLDSSLDLQNRTCHIIAHSSLRASAVVNRYLVMKDEIHLHEFLSQCTATSYNTTELSLIFFRSWEKLSDSLSKIQEKFHNIRHVHIEKERGYQVVPFDDKELLAIIEAIPRAQRLSVLSWKLCRETFDKIQWPKDMQVVHLQGVTNATYAGLANLLNSCSKLTSLSLKFCADFKATADASIKSPSSLKIVQIHDTKVPAAALSTIMRASIELEEFDVREGEMTGEDFSQLPWSCSLRVVRLNYTDISDAAFAKIVSICSHLEVLSLESCRQVTSDAFVQAAWPASLRTVNVQRTSITDDAVARITSDCSKLETLLLDVCRELTSNAFVQVTLPVSLRTLSLGHTKVTRVGLEKVAIDCKNLKSLHLQFCQQLSSQDIVQVQWQSSLRTITFQSMHSHICDDDRVAIQLHCPNLQVKVFDDV